MAGQEVYDPPAEPFRRVVLFQDVRDIVPHIHVLVEMSPHAEKHHALFLVFAPGQGLPDAVRGVFPAAGEERVQEVGADDRDKG